MARVLMVVQHPVRDYDAWRIEYERAQPICDRHGVTDARVFSKCRRSERANGTALVRFGR